MRELYELKEMLMDELKELSGKPMNGSSLQMVDTLAHAIKNICKIIESYEDGDYYDGGSNDYHERSDRYSRRDSYDNDGGSYYDGDTSYARGRGRNAKRDSRGRYASSNYYEAKDDMARKLEQLMQNAPDEKSKQEIQRVMQKLEQM